MSIKTVMAFLNSALFRFMSSSVWGSKDIERKLNGITFPEISATRSAKISALVDEVLDGDSIKQEDIEEFIFSIYGLTNEQINYVRRTVNGKAD